MGECVVANVCTADGVTDDGDYFVGANVLVCECCGGTCGGKRDVVVALNSH